MSAGIGQPWFGAQAYVFLGDSLEGGTLPDFEFEAMEEVQTVMQERRRGLPVMISYL
jgi:hypothetical protein